MQKNIYSEQKYVHVLFFIVLSVLLPACTHKQCKQNIATHVCMHATIHDKNQKLLHTWEVNLPDIPFPLDAEPFFPEDTEGISGKENSFLAYRTGLSYQDLIAFYEQEMERLGWQKMAGMTDFETMLIFAKPDRICSLSLRVAPDSSDGAERILVVINLGKKYQAVEIAQANEHFDEELWS